MPFATTKTDGSAFQASLWLMKPCKLLNEASLVSHAVYPGTVAAQQGHWQSCLLLYMLPV